MIKESELILNPDGSVYHLNLNPENVATTIILVGDPDRVPRVSAHFETVEFKTQKREFCTHTGTYKGKRMTVLSTGIGPDNIDIVINELDALFNIDLTTRTPKATHTELNIVRFGTSGSLQADIPVDSFVLSSHGLGMDNMFHSYRDAATVRDLALEEAFITHTHWFMDKGRPYIIPCGQKLKAHILTSEVFEGITGTAPGFYGPQGRVLRLAVQDPQLNDKLHSFNHKGHRMTNLEMETSAIYGLSALLGHQAVSLNAIIANRPTGTFTKDPKQAVERLIAFGLERLSSF
ncbi:uridine phosphorylase [Capnocytophaga haemolytica]|jgi:purine or other phosphorylase family 1|uniref:Uridine phosphorylase n=1 Tax=Capnocytophaga haemolytica TaxID=45243 RepID=A0AAX2H0C3_9FLAO|nr:nucleoside phosphorylase [Capnocytophaga haemolytica]AMD86197.1 phosphorylase [Capnocytophaga haemolytica]SFN75578.1 uridine phosphorylase [Capnocytophaga haemolytica]SNV07041.1 Purine nucleoside phosphorylase deoD-type [Capnocytophaga haemolytica]